MLGFISILLGELWMTYTASDILDEYPGFASLSSLIQVSGRAINSVMCSVENMSGHTIGSLLRALDLANKRLQCHCYYPHWRPGSAVGTSTGMLIAGVNRRGWQTQIKPGGSVRALNKEQSLFFPLHHLLPCLHMPLNFLLLWSGMEKGERAAFQNASVHSRWCCSCSVRLTALLLCHIWGSAAILGLLSVSRFVFWLLIDLPHNCRHLGAVFVVDREPAPAHSHWMPPLSQHSNPQRLRQAVQSLL